MPNQERIYIGNVVLDDENQDMLAQWLSDIVDSLQGHEHGFDADTVDGFHASAFATAEQGLLAETSLQEGLTIGSTTLINTTEAQFITADGVKIDQELYDALHELFTDIDSDTLLSTLILKLYNEHQDQIDALDENKVDKIPGKQLSTNDFTDGYKSMLDDLNFSYEEIICPKTSDPSEAVTRRALNASAVNHLQFILTTESLYAQYDSTVKDAWNNVFIFVAEEDYPDDYESPLDCPIETGYMFRIDSSRQEEVWLQYKGRAAKNWLDLVKINDLYSMFLEYGDFEDIMREIATTIVTEAIGEIDTSEHINTLIKSITAPNIDDWDDYPFLTSSLKFVYDVVNNGTSLCTLNDIGLPVADVSNVTSAVESDISSLQSNYNNLLTKVTTNTTNISTINSNYIKKSDVNTAITESNNPISSTAVKNQVDSLNASIAQLNTSIQSLTSVINDMRYFQKYLVLGVGQYNGSKRREFVTPVNQQEDLLGAYSITTDSNGNPVEARLEVTNRGNIKLSDGQTYKYNDPDYIYARLIQQHTGIDATTHGNPYIFFQINGVAYARKMQPGTDYATLNIRLDPGVYQVNVIYFDTTEDYQRPIYASQQVVVKKVY